MTALHTTPRALATPERGLSVEVSNVTKAYGAQTALEGVDLVVPAGSFTVLLGPSGSGKTTLLRTIAGIESVDGGTVRLGGTVVDGEGTAPVPPERRDLAMVFQDYALWPHMTVAENVGYALRRGRIPSAERLERVAATLERVGLDRFGGRYPNELSGGQQQRVALARALVGEPRLLLFDEPLSNLDADLRERLRVEISTLTREIGATAVYITHDQSEAFALADGIVVLHHGKVLQEGTAEEIHATPKHRFVARFTGTAFEGVGVVERRTSEHATVRVGDGVFHARATTAVATGAEVFVLARPGAVRIAPDVSHPDGVEADATFAGRVVDVAFRGVGYDHVVETSVGRFVGVRDPLARARGSMCSLVVDPGGCFVFERRPDHSPDHHRMRSQ